MFKYFPNGANNVSIFCYKSLRCKLDDIDYVPEFRRDYASF